MALFRYDLSYWWDVKHEQTYNFALLVTRLFAKIFSLKRILVNHRVRSFFLPETITDAQKLISKDKLHEE